MKLRKILIGLLCGLVALPGGAGISALAVVEGGPMVSLESTEGGPAATLESSEEGPTVTLGYRMHFSALPAYDNSWAADAAESGMLTISPDDLHLLGPGKENETARGTGYVVYRVRAEEGRTFRTLGLQLTGRVFHTGHAEDCGCGLRVLTRPGTGDFTPAYERPADENGNQGLIDVDLTERGAGLSALEVRIEMTGDQWSWVGLSELSVTGNYELGADEPAILFERTPSVPEPAVVGERHPFLPYQLVNAGDCALEIAVTRKGQPVGCDEDGFVPEEEGEYEISLVLTRGSAVVASASYSVWASAPGDPEGMEPEHYLDPGSYLGGGVREGGALVLTGEAAYMRELPFERHIKFRFDISDSSAGSRFSIAFSPRAGAADFGGRRGAGLYFLFSEREGRLEFSAVFSDGEKLVSLGNQPQSFSRPFAGAHAVEIRRYFGDPDFADGCEIYVDGIRFSDWLGYSAVRLSRIVSPDNGLFLSVKAEGAKLSVLKLVGVDSSFPLLDLTGFPGMGTVGEPILLPEAEAVDEIDGKMELTVTCRDPFGGVTVLQGNTFTPLYEGTYEVAYRAIDFSGNVLDRRRDILVSAKEGMPVFRFPIEPGENGRQGVVCEVPFPELLHADPSALVVRVTDPDGLPVDLDENGEFVPDRIGTYTISYTASNEVGTAYTRYLVFVKRDVDEEESYQRVTDASEWVGSEIRQTEAGVKFWGNAYYPRPFEMSNGIEITFDLSPLTDKTHADCWLSLALTGFPGYGNYVDNDATGLYFMFYRQNGIVCYNALTRNSAGKAITVVGGTAIGSDVETIVLRVEKYTGDPNYYDNIVIYVNDVKNENFSIFDVALSDIVDNENFTYLAVGAYGTSADNEALRAGVITRAYFADHTPPAVRLEGALVTSVQRGEEIVLPGISVEDNVDEDFFTTVRMYDPEGKLVDTASGRVLAEKAGSYTIVVKARDHSGNSTIWVRQIRVSEGEEAKGGCSGRSGRQGLALTLLLTGTALAARKKLR